VLNGITVVGSIVDTRLDLREVFEQHAAGKTRVITETRSLGQCQRGDRRRRGKARAGRIVFTQRVLA
jgi:alcohol dehydrogenase, propanol-preferring